MKKSFLSVLLFLFFTFLGIVFLFQKELLKPRNNLSVSKGAYDPVEYTPGELRQLLEKSKDKYAVIDTRTKLEYDKGHLPGSQHADFYDTDALIKTAGNKIPITYDAFSSMRGPFAAYLLYQAGYKNVGILYGGLNAWAEDIGQLISSDGDQASVFMHPKNIFPKKKVGRYPPNQGSVEFNLTAKRFAFVPNRLVVRHGQKVILHLTSIDVIHGFVLPEYNIEEELLPNEPKNIRFIADRKGNFSFITNVVSGRQYASMVGNIIVE